MILRLGHLELCVTNLERARAFYVDALGFIEESSGDDRLYLRALEEFDRWTLCLVERQAPGIGHCAFRVTEDSDLDALESLHVSKGLSCRRAPAGTEPGQGDALRVSGPEGFPIEFYNRAEQLALSEGDEIVLPMRRAGLRHGLGPLRLDHINLRSSDMKASLGYFQDDLGFGISELIEKDDAIFAAWLRRHTGSHDLAVLAADTSALHHFAYVVPESASLLRIADSLADHGFDDAVEFGPARHGVTNALFLYVRDPSGNRLELYTGDYIRDVDLPAIKWPWDLFLERGRKWWGAPAPESFQETTAIEPGWPDSDGSAVRAGQGPGFAEARR